MRIAKTLEAWEPLEDAGLVRLTAEPEEESYFDVFGDPEGYTRLDGKRVTAVEAKQALEASIERDGCWYVMSEYWNGAEWVNADSIGMCAGYANPMDPFQNCYVVDLMRAAIERVGQQGEH